MSGMSVLVRSCNGTFVDAPKAAPYHRPRCAGRIPALGSLDGLHDSLRKRHWADLFAPPSDGQRNFRNEHES